MFGRAATEVVTPRPVATALAIQPDFLDALPSSVKPVVLASIQAARELRTLEAIRLPSGAPRQQRDIYRNRVRELRATADSALRIIVALKRGYQPYTIPPSWYAGYVEAPPRESWALASSLTPRNMATYSSMAYQPILYVFGRPLPPDVLAKYVPLKKEGLFDAMLVAAPNPDYFVRPQRNASGSLFVEPVLVGYIATGDFRGDGYNMGLCFARSSKTVPHIRMAGGIGFLIAHWDLEDDLQAMESGV